VDNLWISFLKFFLTCVNFCVIIGAAAKKTRRQMLTFALAQERADKKGHKSTTGALARAMGEALTLNVRA
jgi:hypothetical protein